MSSAVNRETVDSFQRDGVVLLEGVFDEWIDTLRAGVDINMRDPGPFGRDYLDDGQAGRFFGEEFPLVYPRSSAS